MAKFMAVRAERDAEKPALAAQIEAATQRFLGAVQHARAAHVLVRAATLSTAIVPLRHCYDMHPYFPCLYALIPEYYPSNCAGFDSNKHLDELESAITAESAQALASLR